MFFENDMINVCVKDVLSFVTQKKSSVYTDARNFCALSFRKTADTVLIQNRKETVFTKNSIAFVPDKTDYLRNAEHENMTVIHFSVEGDYKKEIKSFYPKQPDKYEKCFEEMLRTWNNKDIGYRLRSNELLYQLIYMLIREQSDYGNAVSLADRAARLIERNATDSSFSIASLAPSLNVSGTYLRIKFNERFHMSPKEYLTKTRLELASSLLKSKYFSVRDTAFRCGFPNEKYFSQVFKKHMGITPSRHE